jgi:hypothetical protein
MFSRGRFVQILWMLHLSPTPPTTGSLKRTKKIQNFLQYLEEKFRYLILFLVKQYLLMRVLSGSRDEFPSKHTILRNQLNGDENLCACRFCNRMYMHISSIWQTYN